MTVKVTSKSKTNTIFSRSNATIFFPTFTGLRAKACILKVGTPCILKSDLFLELLYLLFLISQKNS